MSTRELTLLPPPRLRRWDPTHQRHAGPFRVLVVGLYSARYAGIGESHGVSVIAGVLDAAPAALVAAVEVLDMAAHGDEGHERIVEAIGRSHPLVLGVAVPYGAFGVLERVWPRIRAALPDNTLTVFGGALPTYLASDVLDLAPSAVVVNGEGERPILDLMRAWQAGRPLSDVGGITYRQGDRCVSTERRLADLALIPPPYRDHLPAVVESGGQIYAESSRACSWAACTFCLRGLTDIEGRPREHRRFPPSRLVEDFGRLSELGIGSVVFADEDFLGQDLPAAVSFVEELAEVLPEDGPSFEISTTIHSVYTHDDDREANAERHRLLRRLKTLGLRKVFLGIESGSDSQLRRYAKGHTAEECAAAIFRVRAAGLRLEVGFIMFDPLCSIDEVAENVAFIRTSGIVDAVSAVENELRLQQGARYLRILERHERETGRQLYDRAVDRDTLSHRYEILDPDVDRLLAGLRPIAAALYSISYPAKNLSRHGEGSPAAGALREVVCRFKVDTLEAIDAGIDAVHCGEDPKPVVEDAMLVAGDTLAAGLVAAQESLLPAQRRHPVLVDAVERCRQFRSAPRAYVAS